MNDLIEQQDHHLIRKIFLTSEQVSDYMIWPYTKDGNFTVKSGYHYIINQSPDLPERAPPLVPHPDLTKKIWTVDTVPKIRHLLWRLLSNILPLLDNQRRRHVVANSQCIRCCSDIETTNHTFFQCLYAQGVWKLSGIPLNLILHASVILEVKLLFILNMTNDNNIPRNVRLLPIWLLWRIWKGRNELLYAKNDLSDQTTFSRAQVDVNEWININGEQTFTGVALNNTDSRQTWSKPRIGWVKCNYDVAHHEGNTPSGMG